MTGISIDGETALYGIIGNPVKHSFSPRMQSLAFHASGINAVYLPFFIQESHLPRLLASFEVVGLRGFNITTPYKEKILSYLHTLSKEAALLQSVNTVQKTADGWKGYNTDGSGFLRSLAEAGIGVEAANVLLVGAGGAARAIGVSLALAGVSCITVFNRTRKKAEALADLIQTAMPEVETRISPESRAAYDILINTTSVGMNDGQCPVPVTLTAMCDHIVDIIYNPPKTPLLEKAAERSIPCMNGLGMLLYQGVEAFEIWTGQAAPVEVMRQSLTQAVFSENGGISD